MLYFLIGSIGYTQTDINALLDQIQKKHIDIQSLEADFIQITTNDAFPQPIEQSGHLFAMRPKMLRWDFQVPMVQSYYTDGTSITVWNEQNNQVLITDQMGDANQAFDLLTDFAGEREKYNIQIKSESAKEYVFSVLPKTASNGISFEQLEVTMNKSQLWITEFLVRSQETGMIQLKFSNIKQNSITDKGVFSFEPPAGAEIIRP